MAGHVVLRTSLCPRSSQADFSPTFAVLFKLGRKSHYCGPPAGGSCPLQSCTLYGGRGVGQGSLCTILCLVSIVTGMWKVHAAYGLFFS